MKIALRELRRRPSRFAMATAILTLLAVLLLFLGGLLDGLLAGSTGALRAQQADAVVFSSNAQDSITRSRITTEVRDRVAAVEGVDAIGGLSNLQLGARVDGRGTRDLVAVVLFGYELAPKGLPEQPPGMGEVYADDALKAEGIEAGTVLRLGPARSEVRVVGFVTDTQFSGQGTLWGSLATWREAVAANRPDISTDGGVVQALVVRTSAATDEVDVRIDAATQGATHTLRIGDAIEALPGVSQQRNTFNQIIGVTVAIAVVVVALFFALLTVERTALYGVLKALGASSRTIFGGVVLQALVVTLIACVIGTGLAVVIDLAIPPGSLPFTLGAGRVVFSTVVLVVAAIAGCAFSLRRVLRIDPAAAIGGTT